MAKTYWGLLGPEKLPRFRRSNTLGLGSTIRMFNQLAVPGLGGVFFGKQVLLAILGVQIAEKARALGLGIKNIDVANCVEAIACWMAFNDNDWQRDIKLRGRQKLKDKTKEDFYFSKVKEPTFYVSQPMRMSTVQILPVLGFVETTAERFNNFRCSKIGADFIDEATRGLKPDRKSSVCAYLLEWVRSKTVPIKYSIPLLHALSPRQQLQDVAKKILINKLIYNSADSEENRKRRQSIWNWLKDVVQVGIDSSQWNHKPTQVESCHWRDMHAGAKFFDLRNAALSILQILENILAQKSVAKLDISDKIFKDIDLTGLANAAKYYLDFEYNCPEANDFARECLAPKKTDVIRALATRDGTGVVISGSFICRGSAFRGNANIFDEDDVEDNPNGGDANNISKNLPLPPGISQRVRNMAKLYGDLILDER